MSLVSSIRQFSTGGASLLAGWIVVESMNETTGELDGPLLNFDIAGYVAIGFSIVAIFLGRRMKLEDEEPLSTAAAAPDDAADPLPPESPTDSTQ